MSRAFRLIVSVGLLAACVGAAAPARAAGQCTTGAGAPYQWSSVDRSLLTTTAYAACPSGFAAVEAEIVASDSAGGPWAYWAGPAVWSDGTDTTSMPEGWLVGYCAAGNALYYSTLSIGFGSDVASNVYQSGSSHPDCPIVPPQPGQ